MPVDDLYFRYMTQGSYRPEEWGHAPVQSKHKPKQKKRPKSKIRIKMDRLTTRIKKLRDELEELRHLYRQDVKNLGWEKANYAD